MTYVFTAYQLGIAGNTAPSLAPQVNQVVLDQSKNDKNDKYDDFDLYKRYSILKVNEIISEHQRIKTLKNL